MNRLGRVGVEDELAPVLAVNALHLVAQLPLQAGHPRLQARQLVLEPQHGLDAGKVQPQLATEEGTARLRRSATLELSAAFLVVIVTGFLTGVSP